MSERERLFLSCLSNILIVCYSWFTLHNIILFCFAFLIMFFLLIILIHILLNFFKGLFAKSFTPLLFYLLIILNNNTHTILYFIF